MPSRFVLLAALDLAAAVAVQIPLEVDLRWELGDYLDGMTFWTVLTHRWMDGLILCDQRSEDLH